MENKTYIYIYIYIYILLFFTTSEGLKLMDRPEKVFWKK